MNIYKPIELTALQKRVIKEWEKTYIAHPSQLTIARKLQCSKETVGRAIKRHLALIKQHGTNKKRPIV